MDQRRKRGKTYSMKVGKKRARVRTIPKTEMPRGRPPEHKIPDRTDTSPDRIVEVVLQAKPKTTQRQHRDCSPRRRESKRRGKSD